MQKSTTHFICKNLFSFLGKHWKKICVHQTISRIFRIGLSFHFLFFLQYNYITDIWINKTYKITNANVTFLNIKTEIKYRNRNSLHFFCNFEEEKIFVSKREENLNNLNYDKVNIRLHCCWYVHPPQSPYEPWRCPRTLPLSPCSTCQ